jgi:uncharacterized protein with GYD domain
MGSDHAVGRHCNLQLSANFLSRRASVSHAASAAGGPQSRRSHMPAFILSLNWTDQGIRSVKDAPKRAKAAYEVAEKVGVSIKQIFLTSGDNDLMVIVDSPSGDNVAKFALALSAQGNVRTRTARAWSEAEFTKLISELP